VPVGSHGLVPLSFAVRVALSPSSHARRCLCVPKHLLTADGCHALCSVDWYCEGPWDEAYPKGSRPEFSKQRKCPSPSQSLLGSTSIADCTCPVMITLAEI